MSWTTASPHERWERGELFSFLRELFVRGRTFGSFTWNPPSVGAATTVDTTLTTTEAASLKGLRAGQPVYVTPPSTLDAGLGVAGAWVATDDTLTVRLMNATAAPINPGSATWAFHGKVL